MTETNRPSNLVARLVAHVEKLEVEGHEYGCKAIDYGDDGPQFINEDCVCTCGWAALKKEASSPSETSRDPFEHTAILADPNTQRIKIAFQEKNDYEAALAFFGMADLPQEPRETPTSHCIDCIELKNALAAAVKVANEARECHDRDQEMRTMKLLIALSGHLPKWRADTDRIHDVLRRAMERLSAPMPPEEPSADGLTKVRDRTVNVALTCSGACRYSNGVLIADPACDTHGSAQKAEEPELCPRCQQSMPGGVALHTDHCPQVKATERRCDVCQVVNVHELSNCAGCGHELQPLNGLGEADMKVKRKDWEALHARVKQLEFDAKLAHSDVLMQSRTGPVLLNVVVPAILRHLKIETRHGCSEVQPVSET